MKQLTILECLEKMKRRDVVNLAFRLGMAPPPHGREALAVWREDLARELPMKGEAVRECLGLIGIDNLTDVIAGECGEDLSVPIARMRGDEAEYDLNSLRELGLAWRDHSRWHIQACVPDMLTVTDEAERALLEASDDLEDVLAGYLMLYGMLRPEDAQRMMLGTENKDAAEVVLGVWTRRRGMAGVYLRRDEVWLLCDLMAEPEELLRQVSRPDRVPLLYAVYSEERAREACRLGVTGDPALIRQLTALARRVHLRKPELLGYLMQAEETFHREERHEAVEIIAELFAGTKWAAMGEHLAGRYVNTIPAWAVKGHTLAEAQAEDKPAQARWSAPCPCGSGRIYGRCCGRAN